MSPGRGGVPTDDGFVPPRPGDLLDTWSLGPCIFLGWSSGPGRPYLYHVWVARYDRLYAFDDDVDYSCLNHWRLIARIEDTVAA